MPTLDEFRNNPGEDVQDAAVHTEETAAPEHTEVAEEEETFQDAPEDTESDDADEVDTELPPEQKSAFVKRMEREREKLRQQLEQEYESKYSRHKQVIDQLGGDPDVIERTIRDNQLAAQARQIAEANGWGDEETQWYLNQQKQEQELRDMRVQLQINDLKDNPDYAGIGSMKPQILTMIQQSGNALTAEQAYWALGGKARADQLKREAQQREIAKRAQPKRTVQTDSPTSGVGAKPLSPDIEAQRKRLRLSETEARALMENEGPGNLEEFRRQKQGRK